MDKREIELAKQNILKDRRRRLVYINQDRVSGQHITESDMKLYSFLKNSNLIGLLVFLLIFGIFGKSIILGLSLMFAIILVAHLYLRFAFLPKRPTVKLGDADFQKMESRDYLKAIEANKFSHIMILIVLALMVLLRFMDQNAPLTGLEFETGRIAIIFFATLAAIQVPDYLKVRKARKQAKQ